MDALEFLKERSRLCKSYKNCKGCPFAKNPCTISNFASDVAYKKIIATVEKWSQEHPRKTRQSVFLEQYPDALISDDRLPEVAPCQLCSGLIHGKSVKDCEVRGLCVECRREFWMQAVST